MRSLLAGSVFLISVALADPPKLPGVGAALQRQVDQNQIAGAVTLVVAPEKILHLEATGWANRESQRPMAPDSVFWIASMSKPITATAVLMAPVALTLASDLGASPYPFAMTVALAASSAFMTPISSPVNTLVLGPGNYVFGDFVRVGVPFTVIVLAVSMVMVPWLLPLY